MGCAFPMEDCEEGAESVSPFAFPCLGIGDCKGFCLHVGRFGLLDRLAVRSRVGNSTRFGSGCAVINWWLTSGFVFRLIGTLRYLVRADGVLSQRRRPRNHNVPALFTTVEHAMPAQSIAQP